MGWTTLRQDLWTEGLLAAQPEGEKEGTQLQRALIWSMHFRKQTRGVLKIDVAKAMTRRGTVLGRLF